MSEQWLGLKTGGARLPNGPVLVIGATGFIGRRVIDALLALNIPVHVLLRSKHGAGTLRARGVQVHIGDAGAAFAAANTLINLAYDVRASGTDNVIAFEAYMKQFRQHKLRKLVHLSSIVVYDGWPNGEISETSTMSDPSGGSYRQAKISMENSLMGSELPAAILQPTLVYGPQSALWTDGFAQALANGGIVVPRETGPCHAVFVDDVVQSVILATASEHTKPARFIISGEKPYNWHDLLAGYQRILGKGELVQAPVAELLERLPDKTYSEQDQPSIAAKISSTLRRALGRDRFEALVSTAKKFRKSKPSLLYPDRHLIDLYLCDGSISIDRACAELGYNPTFDLEAGLRASEPYLLDKFIR